MRLAREYIRKHPGRAAVLMGLHLRQLFDPIPLAKVKGRWIVMLSYGPLLPFMTFGFILSLKRYKELVLIYLIIIVNMLSAAVYGGSSRYRQPIEPFLIMFSAYSFICIGSYIARNMLKRKGRLTAGAG